MRDSLPGLAPQLAPGSSVLTRFPWPSGPAGSSVRMDRTSCCRRGSCPPGPAPGARYLRGGREDGDRLQSGRDPLVPHPSPRIPPPPGLVPAGAASPGARRSFPDRSGQPHPSPGSGLRPPTSLRSCSPGPRVPSSRVCSRLRKEVAWPSLLGLLIKLPQSP